MRNRHRGPAVGERFAGYAIVELLGEGGMGSVYRAERADGSTVALKVIREDLAADDVFRRRFAREAGTAARVRHPRVVELVEVGDADGVPYLAQRYVSGGTLADRLTRETRLPLRDLVSVLIDAGSGIDALHAAGLVHRDLKPANILLDADGRALIADFGLAKDPQGTVLTRPGHVVGSMDYMAPEQIRGEAIGPPADIYALGCVAYECLDGRPPFADRAGVRVLWAHLQDDPGDPCAGRSDLPTDVGWAVCCALAKDATKRPPTATGLARMVQTAADSGPRGGHG